MILSNISLGIKPKFGKDFIPPILVLMKYQEIVAKSAAQSQCIIALERENSAVSKYEFIITTEPEYAKVTMFIVERLVKYLLWARGGHTLYFCAPSDIASKIKQIYSKNGNRSFDVTLMEKIYEKEFSVKICNESEIPKANEPHKPLNVNLDGCRIGFDLGASDYKLAAVKDGEVVFSTEIPWNPKDEPSSSYHYKLINEGLDLAASKLPRVDGIGGSSAGVFVNNRPMVASLFRSIPEEEFESTVKDMFINIGKERNVPIRVINDGDVTALAGAMSLKTNGMFGIAMGSSKATGFINKKGSILGWLNELAFVPVDFSQKAEADEWSKDIGVGALYFSQQAVNRLAPEAGFNFSSEMPLPERLLKVQEAANTGNEQALAIFESIGVFLGYTIPFHKMFYDFSNILILGRVTSGEGGKVIINTTKKILKEEFPDLLNEISINIPDEKSRRVGQAVAAASLPDINLAK